jgi:hypothetical protein
MLICAHNLLDILGLQRVSRPLRICSRPSIPSAARGTFPAFWHGTWRDSSKCGAIGACSHAPASICR